MTKKSTLRPLENGEVYVVLDEASRIHWSDYRPSPTLHNASVVSLIFEAVNDVSRVLIFYAVGDRLQVVPRSYVQKYNIGTGKLLPAWEILTTGTGIP